MTDPLVPPPRRPMPDHLQHRVVQDLDRATARRRWHRSRVVVPLLAVAMVTTTVAVGATALRDREQASPAETATAVPATASPTPMTGPTESATPMPTRTPAILTLDVRPMTKAEIAADRRSCVREDEHQTPLPYQGKAEVQYARVQRSAGEAGAGSGVRVLLMADDIGHWDCLDGQQDGWSRGRRTSVELTGRVPAAPVTNANGGSGAGCGGKTGVVRSSAAFFVDRTVRTGRVRVLRGKQPGPWMTVEPAEGMIYIGLRLAALAADERNVKVEFAFVDRAGRSLPVASGFPNEPATRSVVHQLTTCADLRIQFPRPKAVARPRSDASGIRACRAMTEESAENDGTGGRGAWKSRLVVSTAEEWGTVLSDGKRLLGCSLYPTKEISPFIPDTATVEKSAFSFALNPIGDTGASSLWAAGRVPADVTAISYRLPGDRDVAATIDDDGYWMLKHHTEPGTQVGEPENVSDWPPVVVTVTRDSGAVRHTIPFTEGTMCRQVSHGC